MVHEASLRDQRNGKRSAIVRDPEVRAVDGEHVGGHVRVNVAEDSTQSGLVEHDRLLKARPDRDRDRISCRRETRRRCGTHDRCSESPRPRRRARRARAARSSDCAGRGRDACFAARRRVRRVEPHDGIGLRPIAGACSSAQVRRQACRRRTPSRRQETDDEQGNPHACSESHIGTRVKELSSFRFQGPEP